MANPNRSPTIDELNVEVAKLNVRLRIATSMISVTLLGIASYGQIKLQEVQANIISNEILKTQVIMLNDSVKDIKQEIAITKDLLTDHLIKGKEN